VLFEERGNIVVAGITSNKRMRGIPLTRKEGAVKESVIKINYVFTISSEMVKSVLFTLTRGKWNLVVRDLILRLRRTD
jgi:mRNA interferase MazF